MNFRERRAFDAARNALLDRLTPFLKSVVTEDPVTHRVAGMALVFEWGLADLFAWVPMPVLVDVRKSQAVSHTGEDDPARYWDPWDPEPEQYAAVRLASAAGTEIPPPGPVTVGDELAVATAVGRG